MKSLLMLVLVAVTGIALGVLGFWGFSKTGLYTRLEQGAVIQEALPVLYVTDPDVGPMLRPHTKVHFRTLTSHDNTVVTNAEGFTGRDYPLKTDNYRIAIMGDSAVEAYGVPDSSRFPYVTESLVYSKTHGKLKVEVMGFGVSGWGTVHEYGAIRKYVLKYKPNEIWLMFLATNDTGDNTPLLNAPPLGPTFIYKGPESDEIVDIKFGYPDIPAALEAERRRRYGKYLDDTRQKWNYGLLPYFWSPEHDPQWDLIMDQNLQVLKLVATLCRENGIKVKLLYRQNAYDRSEKNFEEFRKQAAAFLKRDLPMDHAFGVKRFRERVEALGIGFVNLQDMPHAGVTTREQERSVASHLELANYLSDLIIARLSPAAGAGPR